MRPLVPAEQRRTVVDIQVVDLLLPGDVTPAFMRPLASRLDASCTFALPFKLLFSAVYPEITPVALLFVEHSKIILHATSELKCPPPGERFACSFAKRSVSGNTYWQQAVPVCLYKQKIGCAKHKGNVHFCYYVFEITQTAFSF